jgi:hypothetical protein
LTVTTGEPTDVLATGCTWRGNIVSDGGGAVLEHGFIWKVNSDPCEEAAPINNPTGADNYILLGAGAEGVFSTGVTGLDTGSVYLYRAFASVANASVLRPVGPGDETALGYQWPVGTGAHWDKVDEEDTDESVTYVANHNTGSYLRDLYSVNAPALTGVTVLGLTVYFRCGPALAEPNYFDNAHAKASIKPDASVFDGDVKTCAAWAFETFSQAWQENPETDAPWTCADIDKVQVGVALQSYINTGGDMVAEMLCTQVYAEVSYTGESLTTEYGGIRIARTGGTEIGSFYSMAGDGYTWGEVYDDVPGNGLDTTLSTLKVKMDGWEDGTYYPAFLYFDTSEIPTGTEILSATLSVYVDTIYEYESKEPGPLLILDGQPDYPTENAGVPALALADHPDADYVQIASIAHADITVDAYNSVSIPPASVRAGALTKLKMKQALKYADRMTGYYINSGNAETNKPKLVVTYAASGDPPPLPQINVGGTMKTVKNGLIRAGSQWRLVTAAQLNVGGTWKDAA